MAKRARDADEVKRKKFARSRFRNLIRSVALNRIWLVDAEEQKLSLNVKKNIALLVRPQRKIGLLTMAEKSLIRTHHSLRTIEEKKRLISLMSGLNCFATLPPKVRARLSKCVKFMIISPGRKLIKEGNLPIMIYFILTGEVEVSSRVFDHLRNCWVDRIVRISGPGECLGDVELIERTLRTHTHTTRNVVELLVVFDEDFETILRPVMEKQWKEKKIEIMSLGYFKFFTTDQIKTACKLCVLREFEPLETIYYEDKGQLSYVHFVLSGECMILQCLNIRVRQKDGIKSFHLTDVTKEDQNLLFQDVSNIELLKIMAGEDNLANKYSYDVDAMLQSDDNESAEQLSKIQSFKKLDIESLEIRCGLAAQPIENNSEESLRRSTELEEIMTDKTQTNARSSHSQKISDEDNDKTESYNKLTHKHDKEKISHEDNDLKNLSLHESGLAATPSHNRSNEKVENHFIDVGSLTFGGIFGLGESLEHRVIMARTAVQCLMIPRYWLLEKDQNPGNVWQRRRFHLDTTIPSRQTLFKDFVNTRQWHKFKTNLIESHLNRDSRANPTRVQDIPIICRIVEAYDN